MRVTSCVLASQVYRATDEVLDLSPVPLSSWAEGAAAMRAQYELFKRLMREDSADYLELAADQIVKRRGGGGRKKAAAVVAGDAENPAAPVSTTGKARTGERRRRAAAG